MLMITDTIFIASAPFWQRFAFFWCCSLLMSMDPRKIANTPCAIYKNVYGWLGWGWLAINDSHFSWSDGVNVQMTMLMTVTRKAKEVSRKSKQRIFWMLVCPLPRRFWPYTGKKDNAKLNMAKSSWCGVSSRLFELVMYWNKDWLTCRIIEMETRTNMKW